jgi:DMSO reductase family type II enzyme chaperone
MSTEANAVMTQTIRRAQVYGFLADAFLYPADNWTDDWPVLAEIMRELGGAHAELDVEPVGLAELQAIHRRTFGLTGSLCYETECGLPHEFRQSQEMADITGFYRAFGFDLGGVTRERPDHLAAELEFMHVLALKEAYAFNGGNAEHVEICIDAQRKFLKDHLGRWVSLFAQALAQTAGLAPYVALAQFTAAFVEADAKRLGVELEPRTLAAVKPTPLGPPMSCGGCS